MKIVKLIAITLGILVLAAGLAVAGLYMGWFPVPEPLVASIAKAQGLNDQEAAEMTRVVNLYRVVKTAPEAPMIEKALNMAMKEAPELEWKNYAVQTWPQISDETLRRIQDQLQIQDEDFQTITAMLDARIASAATQPESLEFTRADLQKIKNLDEKYGFSELFKKFAQGKGTVPGAW